MRRPLTSRLGATAAAIVFAGTGGITGMEAHPLADHGVHTPGLVALDLGVTPPALQEHHSEHAGHVGAAGHAGTGGTTGRGPSGQADHSGHTSASAQAPRPSTSHHSSHSGHPGHDSSSTECTCVGPCAGGIAPTMSVPKGAASVAAESDDPADLPMLERLIPTDPRSHLLPLANAPPALA